MRQCALALCGLLLAGAALSAAPAAAAPPGPRDLTFFLHYVNATESAKALPGSGSTWTYFDTTTEWNDENATFLANGSLQSFDWYLAPALARNFTVSAASLAFWAQSLSGVPSAQTSVELSERAPSGAETLVSTGNFGSETYTSTPGLKRLNWTLSGGHTFSGGSSIKLTLKVNLGGGSLLILFDTARADSRLTLLSAEAMVITGAQVLDASGAPAASLDPAAADPRARLRTTIQDPLGGYDVAWVRFTVEDEVGSVVVDNASAARVAGTPASLSSSYEVLWNYSGLPSGRYLIFVYAMDGSGESLYGHFGTFAYGPYGDSTSFPAFIGGLPFHAWVRVVDDYGSPLEGARVTLLESAQRGGEASTDAGGLANLTAGPGLYTLLAVLTQVEVARVPLNLTENITASSPLEVRASVFYPALRLVDNQSAALPDASVAYTHPNGSTTLTPLLTGANGTVWLGRTAGGDYHVVVHWRTLTVLDALWGVSASATITVRADVFYVDFTVLDSRGVGVASATVVARDSTSGVVLAFALTDARGVGQARVPGARVDVAVWTRDVQVVDAQGIAVGSDGRLNLDAAVYYVAVAVVDSEGAPVGGALVTVRSANGTVTEASLTQVGGNASLRLPAEVYALTVSLFGQTVASNGSVPVAGDLTLELVVAVHSFAVQVVDSRAVPLQGATLALRARDGTGATVGVGVSDPDGRVSFHVPDGTYGLEASWRNSTVLNAVVDVHGDATVTVAARVAYLTVEVVDREGRPLNEVIVTVAAGASDGGLLVEYTGTNGTASFRLAEGNYTLTSRLIATYLLSPIDQTVVTARETSGEDAEVRVVMTEFQPAFAATNAFAIGVLFFLAAAGLAAFVYVRYQRPGRPGDDEGEPGQGAPPAEPAPGARPPAKEP